MSDKNIAIIGAGIMGRLLAWQLINQANANKQHNFKVTLFDKDPIEQGDAAAYTAAGMLTPYAEIESAEPLIFNMGIDSIELWDDWVKAVNADVGFYRSGSLIVSHAQDKADWQRFNQHLNYKMNYEPLISDKLKAQKNSHPPQQIDQAELKQLEPELGEHFSQATYLPQEAWLCTKCVMKVLAENLRQSGVAWYAHKPIEDFGENHVQFGKQKLNFDWVIDCRGLGAKKQIPELRGVRGELLLLQAPEVKINRLVRLMHPRYRLYLVPKNRDDLYLIGATQIESEDYSEITVRSALELLTAAYSLHSGFAEARILESKTNCRPALANNLPQVSLSNGVVQINGLYRHGFLLAPAIAKEVSRFIMATDTKNNLHSNWQNFKSVYANLFVQEKTSTQNSEQVA